MSHRSKKKNVLNNQKLDCLYPSYILNSATQRHNSFLLKFLFFLSFSVFLTSCTLDLAIEDLRQKTTPLPISVSEDLSPVNNANLEEYEISGTCGDGVDSFEITIGDDKEIPCEDGKWSVVIDLTEQAEGAIEIVTNITNPGTNEPIVITLFKDITPPTAPEDLSHIEFLNLLDQSPVISFTLGTDGGSGVKEHQARIVLESDQSVVTGGEWKTFTSGNPFAGLTLNTNTRYQVQLKAIDNAGNESTVVSSSGWMADNIPPTDPGNLSLGASSSLEESPVISFDDSTDDGGSGVASYEAQVLTASDVMVWDWTPVVSGGKVTGLSLTEDSEYKLLLRAVDGALNRSEAVDKAWIATLPTCDDPNPPAGTVCEGGAIYLGSLSPGSTSGAGTDRYMTTPGGCGDVPNDENRGGSFDIDYYTTADFTPKCSGTDALRKSWNGREGSGYNIPGLTNYTTTIGTEKGHLNTDDKYGSENTEIISAITLSAQGGYHAAARYCDKLVFGGYDDWYLPNRYELNLFWTHRESIPGLATGTSDYYWSSTEYSAHHAWRQRFSDGYQYENGKAIALRVRCVRRF